MITIYFSGETTIHRRALAKLIHNFEKVNISYHIIYDMPESVLAAGEEWGVSPNSYLVVTDGKKYATTNNGDGDWWRTFIPRKRRKVEAMMLALM